MTESRYRSPLSRKMLKGLILLGLMAPVWAFSQAPKASDLRTYSITLSVIDEKSHPVAEARVELRGNGALLSTSTTDASGKIILAVNGAGAYALSIQRKGYLPTETTVELGESNAAQDVDAVLSEVPSVQQSVDVKGEAASPVTETTATQTTLQASEVTNTATHPATLTDALPLIPGIVRAKDGTVRIAGFGEDHSALLVNSVDVTDPSTGNFGLSVPIDSVRTIQVSEMPYLAQYGKFTAGVVSAETRRGGDKWEYSLNDPFPDFHIRSGHLEGVADASPRFNVSGPLVKDRLYFVEGAEYLFSNQEVRTLPYPENLTRSSAFNSFSQIDAVLTPKQTLTASYHIAPHSLEYAGLDYFNPQPVTPNASFHESTAMLTHRWQIGDGVLQSTFAGTGISSDVSPQGNADMVLTPEQNQGNYFSYNSRSATRFAWLEQWTPRTLHLLGDHIFQVGSVFGHSENEGQFLGKPVNLLNANGQLIQTIQYVGGKPYNVSDTEPAVYGQDHWILNSHLALDVGVRLEGQTITSTTRAAPRMGLIWSPGDSGRTVIRGGIGIFYDSVPLDVYAFNSYPNQVITNYNGQGMQVGPSVRYLNVTDQAAHSKFPFVDRKSKSGNFAPYSTAWNLEYERIVKPWLKVRVKYLQSHSQDMITLQPALVPTSSALSGEGSANGSGLVGHSVNGNATSGQGSSGGNSLWGQGVGGNILLQGHATANSTLLQTGLAQGANAFVLGSSGWAQTHQAEITARIGRSPVRQFIFSYVRQYAYGDINDASNYLGNFPSPVIQPNLVSSLPSEIPNRFLLWGTYGNLPKKITLSPHVEYRNGFPYQPTNVYQQWVATTGPQSRYPNYFSVDMRVSKDFQVNVQHAVRLSLTIRNLTNHFNPLEVYSNLASPQYGTFFGNYNTKVLFDFDFLY